ncbi:MAG: hypothetical protein HOP28_12970 [Gemmatimonadales bacterium]|nr:hypothetical protein [Gemmatimonadales bacterium]
MSGPMPAGQPMTDAQLANAVHTIAGELNQALARAAQAGLRCDVKACNGHLVISQGMVYGSPPNVQVSVVRPL